MEAALEGTLDVCATTQASWLTKLAPSMPFRISTLLGRQRKNSLDGKGECKKSPIAAEGNF